MSFPLTIVLWCEDQLAKLYRHFLFKNASRSLHQDSCSTLVSLARVSSKKVVVLSTQKLHGTKANVCGSDQKYRNLWSLKWKREWESFMQFQIEAISVYKVDQFVQVTSVHSSAIHSIHQTIPFLINSAKKIISIMKVVRQKQEYFMSFRSQLFFF